MSSIAFHTKERTVRVGGVERMTMGWRCWSLFRSFLHLEAPSEQMPRFIAMLPPDHYAHQSHDKARAIETALHVSRGDFRWRGEDIDLFALHLNTALVVGNDVIKLMARLHGSCEIHAWVDGPNRAWLASIAERGLALGLLGSDKRLHMYPGWPAVIELLRESDQGEVVTSYSVTDSFPNYEDREDEDEDREQMSWDVAMDKLRKLDGGFELKPDNWDTFRFGHCLSAVDLVADDYAERFDRAFGVGEAA